MLRIYAKSYLYSLIAIIIGTLIITILSYFDIIGPAFLNILKTIFLMTSVLIGSYNLGRGATDRAYLYGIKYSTGIFIILFLTNIIFIRTGISFLLIVSYIIIFMSGIIGSIFGINTRKEKITSK